MKYNIVLLQYEQTKGMKSLGPKALLKIKLNNKIDSIINYQLQQTFIDSKNDGQTIIVLGFDKEKIIKILNKEKHKIEIIENLEYKIYNQSYAMMLALQQIQNKLPTIVIDSGVILQKPFVLEDKSFSKYNIIFTGKNEKDFDIGCTTDGSDVEYMFYDLTPRWINMVSICDKYRENIINISKKYKNSNIFEIINYSLKECDTKIMQLDNKAFYVKNQKHKLVK